MQLLVRVKLVLQNRQQIIKLPMVFSYQKLIIGFLFLGGGVAEGCRRHTERAFGLSLMNSGPFMTQFARTFALNLQFSHVKLDWEKSDPEQSFLLIFYTVAAQ